MYKVHDLYTCTTWPAWPGVRWLLSTCTCTSRSTCVCTRYIVHDIDTTQTHVHVHINANWAWVSAAQVTNKDMYYVPTSLTDNISPLVEIQLLVLLMCANNALNLTQSLVLFWTRIQSTVWEFVSVVHQKLLSFVADIMIGCTYPYLRLVLNRQ